MKKYLSIACMVFFFLTNLYGQAVQTQSWSDGDTLFFRVIESQGVLIDSTVRLTPIYETHVPDSFQYILYGEDAIWPIQTFPITAAYDIDYIHEKGNDFYLVTDGLGHRVFEINFINPDNPIGPVFSFTGQTYPLINPVDASNFYRNGDRKILITDAGGHRVIQVDRWGFTEEWSYGDGNGGSGFNQLLGPSDAIALPDTNLILISDQGNKRIILVNPADNSISWSYTGTGQLNPVDIEYDESNRAVLITDQGKDALGANNHRVLLVSIENDSILWELNSVRETSLLSRPTDADILDDGTILICDAGNSRLLAVNYDKEVVWSFEHRPLYNLRDADRLPDNRTIVVADYPPLLEHIPVWLGYTDSLFVSPIYSIGKKVNIDSIVWQGETPANTLIKIQLRSADNRTDLAVAPWYGPSDSVLYFTDSVSAVNQQHHQAHSYYQFRAYLETSDSLHTPILNDLQVKHHSYLSGQPGTVTSEVITDSAGIIITKWLNLGFKASQNESRNIKVSIINALTGDVLKDFYAEDIGTKEIDQDLSIWDKLKGIQSILLEATLTTNNTASTPVLYNWDISWNSTMATTSQLYFVDSNEQPVDYYRVSPTYPPVEQKVDQVSVLLNDLNLATVQESITLQVQALRSGDLLNILLQRSPDGEFILQPSVPAVIFNLSIPGNTFLEVFNRDTLVVNYTDPTTPADTNADTTLIVQNSTGELQIINNQGAAIDTAFIGDTLYISLLDESDHNITPARDTVWIELLNNETDDYETIPLIETPDTSGTFYTGDFISAFGIILAQRSTGIVNDKILQTMPTNQIAARYVDNVTLQDFIVVQRGDISPYDSLVAVPKGPIDFDIAPNPYYANRHSYLRIRASSAIGNMTVDRIEIYNIAGHKVRSISRNQLPTSFTQTIPINNFVYSEFWWDLRNDDNDYVSSGTYWVKMYGSLASENGGSSDQLTTMRKLIIVR